MVFERFGKKKEEYKGRVITYPPPPYQPYQQTFEELKSLMMNLSSILSRVEQSVKDLIDRIDRLEKALSGYFIIQLSHIPATAQDLAKMLNLRGVVLLRDGVEIERYGEISIDYKEMLSINFSNILHIDREGTHLYMLKSGNKTILVEVDRELDYCALSIIKKFLEFF